MTMKRVGSTCTMNLGTACIFFLSMFSNYCLVDGAKAVYVFGDSYLDTGNSIPSNDPMAWAKPYGKSWPGYPDGRYSNGHTETDFIVEHLKVPLPIPIRHMRNSTDAVRGINFAVGGAGITYAWAKPTMHTQVDEFEHLIQQGHLSKQHLAHSVAFVGMTVNDYNTYLGELDAIPTLIDEVVDGLAYNMWRIHNLGLHNIMVANVAPLACLPATTFVNNFTHCVAGNATLTNETTQHNALLAEAVRTLHNSARGMHVILLNQTRAFEHVIHHAFDYGFVDPTMPCCKGKDGNIGWRCGFVDDKGESRYDVCSDPAKSFWWDYWHPTEAGWKAVVELYWSHPGFTHFGRDLKSWVNQYHV